MSKEKEEALKHASRELKWIVENKLTDERGYGHSHSANSITGYYEKAVNYQKTGQFTLEELEEKMRDGAPADAEQPITDIIAAFTRLIK